MVIRLILVLEPRPVAVGQVRLIAAEFMGVEPRDDHVRTQIRRRGSTRYETLNVARVYYCGGVSVDVTSS